MINYDDSIMDGLITQKRFLPDNLLMERDLKIKNALFGFVSGLNASLMKGHDKISWTTQNQGIRVPNPIYLKFDLLPTVNKSAITAPDHEQALSSKSICFRHFCTVRRPLSNRWRSITWVHAYVYRQIPFVLERSLLLHVTIHLAN